MIYMQTTGPFERSNVNLGVGLADAGGISELTGYLMLNVYAGAATVQTYMTAAQARALAAELTATAALIDIRAQAAPQAIGAGVPA